MIFFSINATINRFFTFHFQLPNIILALVITHQLLVLKTASNKPIALPNGSSGWLSRKAEDPSSYPDPVENFPPKLTTQDLSEG